MDELQKAIKQTKIYSLKYGQILNDDQLFLRLISTKVHKFEEVRGQGKNKPQDPEWKRKMSVAEAFSTEHLSKIEGIEMVGITGSVAAEAAKKGEDIDLLIITKKDELWWWRLYLRIYMWWHKIPHRRFGERENNDEFCFNLWLDKDNLGIPAPKRNLKNATDLVMMKVILNKHESYQKFLRENEWVKKFLATGYSCLLKKDLKSKNEKSNLLKKVGNRIMFWGQYLYMWSKGRQKLKNVEIGQAFFHKDG